jgi:DNA-binding response OmpR family regulator
MWVSAPVIVLIDDEPLFRRSMATLLARWGYRAECAATATDGLALLRAAPADLVLLDRTLPDGDGLDLLPRNRREWPRLPILMITGDPCPEPWTHALHAGAVAVLEKPCEPEILLAAVAAALQPANAPATPNPQGEAGETTDRTIPPHSQRDRREERPGFG